MAQILDFRVFDKKQGLAHRLRGRVPVEPVFAPKLRQCAVTCRRENPWYAFYRLL